MLMMICLVTRQGKVSAKIQQLLNTLKVKPLNWHMMHHQLHDWLIDLLTYLFIDLFNYWLVYISNNPAFDIVPATNECHLL